MATRPLFRTRMTTTAALILLAACSVDAVAGRTASRSDCACFQEMADRAALAGVDVLAATDGRPEPERIDAATRAANAVMAQVGAVATETAISTGQMSMRVSLTSKRGTPLHATARYIAPGDTLTGRRDERIAARRG